MGGWGDTVVLPIPPSPHPPIALPTPAPARLPSPHPTNRPRRHPARLALGDLAAGGGDHRVRGRVGADAGDDGAAGRRVAGGAGGWLGGADAAVRDGLAAAAEGGGGRGRAGPGPVAAAAVGRGR